MNELRLLRISDVDTDRIEVRVRQRKGKKDRYVILSGFIKERLPDYLKELQPQVYLFEGQTPGEPMGERSIQYIIGKALNLFCLHYPEETYNNLFVASKETLMQSGRDPKHLGAKIGCIAILHTWGQNLSLHPHLHVIVPAGGTDHEGNWIHSRQSGKYLFPVKAMGRVFRGKFMEQFRRFMTGNGMETDEELHRELYRNDWVVTPNVRLGEQNR